MTNLMTAQGGDFLAHRTQSSAFRRGGVVEVDRGATADIITTYSENALRLHGWASTHALPNRRASAPDTINAINFSDGEDAPRLHEWALAHASPNMDALALEKIRAAVIYCLVDSPATDLEGLDTGMILVGQNGETVNIARAAYPVELAARHPQRRGTALRERCCFLPVVESPNCGRARPWTSTRGISGN